MAHHVDAAGLKEFAELLATARRAHPSPGQAIDVLLANAIRHLGVKCITLYLFHPQLEADAVLWKYPGVTYTPWMFGPLYPDSAKKRILDGGQWRIARWPATDPVPGDPIQNEINKFSFTSREGTDFYLRYDSRFAAPGPATGPRRINGVMFLNFPPVPNAPRGEDALETLAFLVDQPPVANALLRAMDTLFSTVMDLIQDVPAGEAFVLERPGELQEFDASLLSLFTKSWSRITSLAWESVFADIACGIERLAGASPNSCSIFSILKAPWSRDDPAELQVLNKSFYYAKDQILTRTPRAFAAALVALKHSPLILRGFAKQGDGGSLGLVSEWLAPGFRIEVPCELAASEMRDICGQIVVPVISEESRAPVGIIDLRFRDGCGQFPQERIRMVYRLGYVAGIAISIRWMIEHLKFITRGFFHDLTDPMHRLRDYLPRPEGRPELAGFLTALDEHIEFMFRTVTSYQDLAQAIIHREDPAAVEAIFQYAAEREEPYCLDRPFFAFLDHLFAIGYDAAWAPLPDPLGVHLLFDLQSRRPVAASRSAVRTIVYNLVKNAVHHAFGMSWNGEKQVRIAVRDVEDDVEISIQDNGAGLPEMWRNEINAAYRDEMAIVHKGGLYTAKKLVRLMGARLNALTPPGGDSGTLITLRLAGEKGVSDVNDFR